MSKVKRMLICTVIGLLTLGISLASFADSFPDRPLTLVVPASTGGTNDRYARLMAGYLEKELGQPVKVVNRPGGGNLAGHEYFMQQPADGYTLLRTTTHAYLTINVELQGADFKFDDFHYVNATTRGRSMLGTAKDGKFKDIYEAIDYIKENPGEVTIGLQPTQTDNINLQLFLKALGIGEDDVRILTYDSGSPVRNGMINGHFDIAAIGDQGMKPRADLFTMLMHFSDKRSEFWDVPTVLEVTEHYGVEDYGPIVPGPLQGFLVHTELKEKYPERYEKIVEAFFNISNDSAAVKDFNERDLPIPWRGPVISNILGLRAHNLLRQPVYLNAISK